jgi:hypothetical protein
VSTGVPWVDAALAVGGTLGGISLVAWMVIKVQQYLANVQTDIVAQYRDEVAQLNARITARDAQHSQERARSEQVQAAMTATVAELRQAVTDAEAALREKSREKHEALNRLASYEMERSTLRRIAVEEGCTAVVAQLDRMTAVRAESSYWPDLDDQGEPIDGPDAGT